MNENIQQKIPINNYIAGLSFTYYLVLKNDDGREDFQLFYYTKNIEIRSNLWRRKGNLSLAVYTSYCPVTYFFNILRTNCENITNSYTILNAMFLVTILIQTNYP
jgi:hypothetical protein